MKYKVGDRVYFNGRKHKVIGVRNTPNGQLLAFEWSRRFITSSKFKPVITCK